MHHKGWTREQALEYMRENSSMPETDAIAEIERYIAIPSQALAYKVGQLKISELRAKSEQALGDRFDVRDFHAQVLRGRRAAARRAGGEDRSLDRGAEPVGELSVLILFVHGYFPGVAFALRLPREHT